MISSRQLLFGFILLMFIACKNQIKKQERSEEIKIDDVATIDSATEATMLNPKFDENKIRGFGIFKIGNSFDSTISYLLTTNTYKIDSFSTSAQKRKFEIDHILDKRKFIVKLNHPKSTLDRFDQVENSSWCSDTKAYLVTKYSIDNLTLESVCATYYKNRLVEVSCKWSSELLSAVESKFGKPDENISNLNLNPMYYSTHWINQDIKAGYTSLSGLIFDIEIKGGFKFLDGCDMKGFEVQDKIDKEKKKSELKDF